MARSTCIYVVMEPSYDYVMAVPEATFTVKHECKTWLKRTRNKNELRPRRYILTYRDNPDPDDADVGEPELKQQTEEEFMEA